MKIQRVFSLLLAVALLFCMLGCNGEQPPVTPPDGGEGEPPEGDNNVQKTLSITGPQYATVGEVIRFTLAGENCDPAGAQVTLSDPSGATAPTLIETRCSMRLLKEGTLTVTATCEGAVATCQVTVLPENGIYTYEDEMIRYIGRTSTENNVRVFRNTASGFEVTFYGEKLTAKMPNVSGTTVMSVFVDDETDPEANKIYLTDSQNGEFVLAKFKEAGLHTVRVQKVTEESISIGGLLSLSVDGGGILSAEKAPTSMKIVAYGDSITCGYGNMRTDTSTDGLFADTQNGLMTYAAIAARALQADYEAFARSGIGLYTNAHNMAYTMLDVYDYVSPMSNGSQKWDLSADAPDVVIINLGTNDLGATQNKVDSIPAGMPLYSNDGIRAAYVEFVQKLNTAYGEGVIYFLVGGMMTNGTDKPMQDAAAALQAEGIEAHALNLPARTGYGGHPALDVHQAAAEVLYDAIIEAYFG